MTPQPAILLISPNGMLGTAWSKLLDRKGMKYRVARRPDFDITQSDSIDRAITNDLDLVINCSAWTDVDGAEEHEDLATAVNGHGVGELAKACKRVNAKLIHYSTDYVFNGQAGEPYNINQPLDPLNAYGRSKAVGEQAIRDCGVDHLILRTSWLYAPWGNNFVLTMTKLTADREELKVVDDQHGRPTSCEHLAAATLQLIEAEASGTLHLTDGGQCTWRGLAAAVGQRINPQCDVKPCTTADFPRPAKRPAYSVLDLQPTEAILGPMPSWQDNLAAVLDQL